jgi:hypothetical protein
MLGLCLISLVINTMSGLRTTKIGIISRCKFLLGGKKMIRASTLFIISKILEL